MIAVDLNGCFLSKLAELVADGFYLVALTIVEPEGVPVALILRVPRVEGLVPFFGRFAGRPDGLASLDADVEREFDRVATVEEIGAKVEIVDLENSRERFSLALVGKEWASVLGGTAMDRWSVQSEMLH